MRRLVAVLLLATIWCGFFVALRTARAQEPDVEGALALAVAKVAANEASLTTIRPAEVALIWQTAEARASTPASRLAWLRAHSSCVLGDRPLRTSELRTNCRWTRNLRDDDTQPDGWPVALAWSRYAPRWAQVRALAVDLVEGRNDLRPCPGDPFTWGSRVLDMQHALDHGLVPLGCVDRNGEPTLNEGFALRGRS